MPPRSQEIVHAYYPKTREVAGVASGPQRVAEQGLGDLEPDELGVAEQGRPIRRLPPISSSIFT